MTLDCPAHIEFLLWCHTRMTRFPEMDLELYQNLATRLLNCKLIYQVEDHYETTPKGKAFVQLLCNITEPTEAFVDEQGRVIIL